MLVDQETIEIKKKNYVLWNPSFKFPLFILQSVPYKDTLMCEWIQ